jgi:hypothetical protein
MIEKPKKERRFLKTLGRVGEILIQEVLIKIGSNLIKKLGGKQTLPSILFLLISLSLFAQYPATGNKQRLGYQTTGDGLVYRGRASDTTTIKSSGLNNAYFILDTVNNVLFNYIKTKGGWQFSNGDTIIINNNFTQPVDSLFFNVGVPTNNVDTAKMRWDSDLATVVLGLNDNVPNELGFKNFWLVKNQTGSAITKGSIVYANGTVGASGRITVAKFIANGSIDAKYLLGITAHDLSNGEDGYVISFGKIRQVNTDTFATGAILYPSPTVAGVWTDVEPVAPNIDMPIGFCINSSSNNGTIAIRVASGYDLSELHDVAISSPVENSSLYYKSGLWRDTTAALLVSDTASMLANYATKAYADTTGRFYARQDFTNVSSSTLTWTQSDTLIPAGVTVVQVYRNGQILLPTQYTIPTSTSVVIAATSYKVGENYTVIFPRGGGAGSGGGSGSLTSISGGTGILVSPNPITTTGTVSADLSVLMELTDTSLLNLTSRLATKLNISDTAAMLSNYNTRINSKLNISDTLSMLAPYFRDADTSLLNLTSRFALKLNATDTASLSSRIDAKGTGTVTSIATGYGLSGGTITSTGTLVLDSAVVFSRIRDSIVDVAIGNDTIKILKQEYNSATTSVLTWTITPKFPIQLKAYILVFRNGQLLINDQYNLTDTNQITIVSNSFKVGANYTVVTVSGIGSVGTGTFPNPVYPEAGIAVSTGTTWTTSIPNNSSNWNIAFNDKITNAAFTGTNTKTLTLTQYDGGTFTPTFTDLQGVTGSGTIDYIPKFSTTTEVTNSVIQESSGNIGIGTTPIANLTFDVSKNILLKSGSTGIASILFSETGTPSSTDVEFGGILRYNGSFDRMELVTRDNLGGSNVTNTGITMDRITGNIGLLKPTTISSTLAVTGAITEGGNNVLTNLDTASLSSRIDLKLNKTDTASLSSRIDLKLNKTDTASLSSRIDLKLNKTDTASLSTRINGKVSLTGDEYINGQKTFGGLIIPSNGMQLTATGSNSNKLIGINASSFVGEVTLGTGLTLTSNVLNANDNANSSLFISRTGTTVEFVEDLTIYSVIYLKLNNNSTITVTLPTASLNTNKSITIKNIGSGAVNSNASNVEPLNSSSLSSVLLVSGGGKFTTVVSDGTNWIKMAGN